MVYDRIRLNPRQIKVLKEKYEPVREQYNLNKVRIPKCPTIFCNQKRCEEILTEIEESQAEILVLLGDIPIQQFLNRVAEVNYSSLQEYVDLYGYGNCSQTTINGRSIKVLPLAHPRQIGALGAHSEKWNQAHLIWEKRQMSKGHKPCQTR